MPYPDRDRQIGTQENRTKASAASAKLFGAFQNLVVLDDRNGSGQSEWIWPSRWHPYSGFLEGTPPLSALIRRGPVAVVRRESSQISTSKPQALSGNRPPCPRVSSENLVPQDTEISYNAEYSKLYSSAVVIVPVGLGAPAGLATYDIVNGTEKWVAALPSRNSGNAPGTPAMRYFTGW
jgi:hypothetical protein